MLRKDFYDFSTGDFPKTLLIRNEPGGMIWQVYHPDNIKDVEEIKKRAFANGFEEITLTDYAPNYKETFPDWRSTKAWKD
jgi:hypothetical protein